MALALRQAAELKPELRLAQAISEFEADLSDQQKIRFRKDKSQSPHPDDVMRLTAEIDRSMLQQGNRRCYGPRLTNFLQGVQKFASIGDIVIGGSQFLPACGVWTLVRFSLMSIVQYKSYVDSMSLMFMEIGRSAPSYQRMALLYPQSRHLQANVLEYFILVVQLCHRMLKYSKKSSLKQFFDSTYNSSSTDRKDLEKWSMAIRDEMHIATARANQDESQKNSAFRFIRRQEIEQKQAYHQQTKKFDVLDAISTYDYQTTWKQLRKVGNTTVLKNNSEYMTSKLQSSSNTLILSGQLGAGKSIVLANMVDDLFLNPGTSTLVAYFFCRHDIPESLIARVIVGAMARQLLKDTDLSVLPPQLIRDRYDINEIIAIVSELLSPRGILYVVLDGIHECNDGNQSEVFGFLAVLQSRMRVSVCISTRTNQSLALTVPADLARPIHVKMPQENPDINLYIEQELESLLVSGKMLVQDPKIVLEIRDQLVSKSEGMFLWVYLQILLLCFESSDHGIRQVLKELPLPKDLAVTYTRLLDKATTTIKDSIRARCLSLIVAAFRPLTVKELQESLSVIPGDTSWDASKLINNITTVLSACGGLLVFDEEQETMRLFHASALQFLQHDRKYLIGDVHEVMVYTIVTYLYYPIFETSISNTVVPTVDAKFVPAGIISSTLQPSTQTQQLAIRLLKLRGKKEQDISKLLAEQRQKIVYRSDFQFQHYAREYWFQHLCEINAVDSTASKLLNELLQSEKLSLVNNKKIYKHFLNLKKSWTGPWTESIPYNDTSSIELPYYLCWAVNQGRLPLVKLLLDNSSIDPNSWLVGEIYPLEIAIKAENPDMVSLLLRSDRICCNWMVHGSGGPLEIAIKTGNLDIVSLLLKSDKIHCEGDSPLETAIKTGDPDIVSLLLKSNRISCKDGSPLETAFDLRSYNIASILLRDNRIDPDATTITKPGTLLVRAIKDRNFTAARLLLQCARTNKNQVIEHGRSALYYAVREADELLPSLLSASDVDVNTLDNFEMTPLTYAISHSPSLQVVSKLLSIDRLDLNSASKYGRTPLGMACRGGNTKIAKLLISDNRVDLNAQDTDGKTALYMAALKNNIDCVLALLWQDDNHTTQRAHLDPNIADKDGRTPLFIACQNGNTEITKLLTLDNRVDLNAQNRDGKTALYMAALKNNIDCVLALLWQDDNHTTQRAHLNPNIADKDGQTPLHRATANGRLTIVTELLKVDTLQITQKNGAGMTAAELAESIGRIKIPNRIRAYESRRRMQYGKDEEVEILDMNNDRTLA